MNPLLITVISVVVIVPAIIAGIISQYQRETTSIEDKYMYRSAEEIDETYHQSYLDPNLILPDATYNDEVVTASEVTGPTIKLSVGNDRDGDTIPNNEELTTQPDNPDSDGDGIIDSQDPYPTDPTRGKTAPPPPTVPETTVEIGELQIKELYKNVRNLSRGATQWVNHTTARPGETLAFLIYLELVNTSTATEYEATLYDFLDDNLRYIGSGTVNVNNQTPESLAGSSWMNGYLIKVPAGQTKLIEIRFSAVAELRQADMIVLANNIVKVVSPHYTDSDNAFVSINSHSTFIPPTL